ncbi:hypothetical protein [Chryseobacterium sp. JM1]|uniref:hypothetical protein n=1 Tax=Chryseobacterium sp. JM1 TaxID=1233950 RepID=UPI0004E68E14|nr:hypothetical protein [Chryseobacterium sp. JM1]KFF20102.1 hypothetical protein IW22_14385 [Chryseobacterium sp. JM1]
MHKIVFILTFIVYICQAQVVIGSGNVTPGAMLKLDSHVKGLRIPVLSITNKTSTVTPVLSPANGLIFYNTNTDIANNIGETLAYWSTDNQYHFHGTQNITKQIIYEARIPVLIFSAKIGSRPASTSSFTQVSVTASEILEDTYYGWNSNKYTISTAGVYTVEFTAEISHPTGTGVILSRSTISVSGQGPSSVITSASPFIISLKKGFSPATLTFNALANTNIVFRYSLDMPNYQLESGTISIYKH